MVDCIAFPKRALTREVVNLRSNTRTTAKPRCLIQLNPIIQSYGSTDGVAWILPFGLFWKDVMF
jgi:hypothetical protein